MKRLFVAIPVETEPALGEMLLQLQRQLAHEKINWVNTQNLHLTLKFIGEQPTTILPDIRHLMTAVASRHKAFSLNFGRTGIFGSRYDPRVLWLGCSTGDEPVKLLANDLLNEFTKIGFERDRQNFVPHLTLARIKHLSDKPLFQRTVGAIPQQHYATLRANGIVLYESVLRKEGPQYFVLSEAQLVSSS